MEADAPMILVMGVTGSGKSKFVNYLMPGATLEGTTLRSGGFPFPPSPHTPT